VIYSLKGLFRNGTWQTRLTLIVRDSRQHWTGSWRLAFAEERIDSKNPQQRRGNSSTLVCISSPRWFFYSSWWCVDTEADKVETLGHISSPIMLGCYASTHVLVEPFGFTIAYVDLNLAGKRVGENNKPLFSWHWPGDNESILPIVTPLIDITISWIVNAAISSLPDPNWKIRELWGCWEESIGDGGPYTRNVTAVFDYNTAAQWVKAVMKLSNPKLFCVVYSRQQPDSTAGAQTPRRGGPSYLPLNDILPPPAEDIIDDIEEESDDDGETRCPYSRHFPMTKTGFQMFEWTLQNKIIRPQRYPEVIWNCALGIFANYEQVLLLVRMQLGHASTIILWMILLQALSPIGSVNAAAQLQISHCKDRMHWLDGCSRICGVGRNFSGTLEGGQMGDNLEFFSEVLCLFWCFVYFITT